MPVTTLSVVALGVGAPTICVSVLETRRGEEVVLTG